MKNLIVKTLALVLLGFTFISTLHAEALWIDVRSTGEYAQENLGDLNIPHNEIAEQISKHAGDKNTEIKLYCRSGGRAGKAKSQLEALGYTNVTNEGGISDAREKKAGSEGAESKTDGSKEGES